MQAVLQTALLSSKNEHKTDITPTGAVLTITDTNESPFVYGEWFTLEKKEGDEWFGLHPIIENYSFFDLGYRPNQNGKVIIEMDWEKLYGKLPKGSYRVLKKAGLQYIAAKALYLNTVSL